MKLRKRVGHLQCRVDAFPGCGGLSMIVCVPAGCDAAEGRPPGTYFNADRAVATVVFAGPEPDPGVLAPLQGRMPTWGLTLVCQPG